MKNKIIEVYKIANRLVSITVEEPDFSDLKINHFVMGRDLEILVVMILICC